jgi:hypothetical protein
VILLLLTLQSIPNVTLTSTCRSPRVRKSSGVAVSRAHAGVLWTHNDSGDDTAIYTFVAGAGGLLSPSGWPVCNVTGLEPQGEASDFLDDSTFVLTSEAASIGRGLIHTVRCPGRHREE